MSEHQQSHIQDSTPDAGCPKNLWGHSWKRLDGPEGAMLQRCRFCHQTREKPPSTFHPVRAKKSADVLQAIADEELEHDYYGHWHRLFVETFLERAVFDRVYRQVLRLLPSCPEERSLVHGNPSLSNLLAQGGTLTAVLDCLDARYGDFVFDIAYLDYWAPHLRVREHFERFYRERGIPVPAYAARIRRYQCYLALDAMHFYAGCGQEQGYAWVRALEELP